MGAEEVREGFPIRKRKKHAESSGRSPFLLAPQLRASLFFTP
jgi:hypothetical protein